MPERPSEIPQGVKHEGKETVVKDEYPKEVIDRLMDLSDDQIGVLPPELQKAIYKAQGEKRAAEATAVDNVVDLEEIRREKAQEEAERAEERKRQKAQEEAQIDEMRKSIAL